MTEIAIQMPQLGEAVAEAEVIAIKAKEGEFVNADAVVMEVETSKAVMEVTALYSGKISKILAKAGETYSVGMTLGYMQVSSDKVAKSSASKKPDIPKSEKTSEENKISKTIIDEQDETPPVAKSIADNYPIPAPAVGSAYLSPRMKSRMEEMGLNSADLAGIAGSGRGGRITIDDFENFLRKIEKSRISKASSMRVAVADSMRRSWSRPLATIGMSLNMDPIIEHRKTTKPKPGITVYAMKALALALAHNLAPAGRLVGNRIVHPSKVDIGFAVEVDNGVLVPVVYEVDKKSLAELVGEYETALKSAKARKLPQNSTLQTGAATITNYSTFRINWATPIPLPEQNFVLGIGVGKKVPSWNRRKNAFVPITEAELTLSFDHRLMDGGAAGRLLNKIIKHMEKPNSL